jgi:hypothetical protein
MSRKSIPAALYGAVFSGQLRSLRNPTPDTLGLANATLMSLSGHEFIAAGCIRIVLNSRCRLANGGMPFPILSEGGSCACGSPGVPLGLFEEHILRDPFLFGAEIFWCLPARGRGCDGPSRMYDEHRLQNASSATSLKDDAICPEACTRILLNSQERRCQDDITILALRQAMGYLQSSDQK